MPATEQHPAGRQVIYQAILSGGWRVFLPWASQRELDALIASGPADPSDPLSMPMQLARWIDRNRTQGADFHLGPDWRDHFVTVWLGRARIRFAPSVPPPDPEAVAEVHAQRARGADARARTPELAEAVKAAKNCGAVLMARGRLTPEAWRALRRALDQAEDLATVDALIATLR